MSFELIPNISLVIAIVGILVLVGRRLPEASNLASHEEQVTRLTGVKSYFASLGIYSRLRTIARFWMQRVWHFLLEAKDIKKPAAIGYRIKKMLPKKKGQPTLTLDRLEPKVADEGYYLQLISENPKELENYAHLGKLYAELKRFPEARDIFLFLVKRDPSNANFYARLAFASFKLELFTEAVDNYERSLALDSAQPNRYYNLSLSLDALGKTQEALIPIKKALELEPQNRKYLDLLHSLEEKIE